MTIMRPTVEDLADWIITNRRGRAFANYTKDTIMEEISEAIYYGVFVYHCEDNKIQGVACGKRYDDDKIIWIHDVLTTRPDIIKLFMERFLLVYPEWTIKGQRNGMTRTFSNPSALTSRL